MDNAELCDACCMCCSCEEQLEEAVAVDDSYHAASGDACVDGHGCNTVKTDELQSDVIAFSDDPAANAG